jgi:hypothetical protein
LISIDPSGAGGEQQQAPVGRGEQQVGALGQLAQAAREGDRAVLEARSTAAGSI